MKKATMILAILAMTALIGTAAMAYGPGWGRGGGCGGYGNRGQAPANTQMTAEQKAEFDKARAGFLKDTEPLRKQMAVTRVELSTLEAQPNPDQAKLTQLRDQMVDIRAQLAKKRNKYMPKFQAGGYGPGNCPGWGRGSGKGGGYGKGRGGRGGYGPGNCWR